MSINQHVWGNWFYICVSSSCEYVNNYQKTPEVVKKMKNAERRPPFFSRPERSEIFLLRLRQRKCNFEAPGPSQIHFFRFPSIFQKIQIFIIFWSIFWFSNHPHSLKQSSKEASEMISLTCSSMDARAFLFSSTLVIPRFQDLMQRSHENSKGPDQPEGPTKMQRWRRVLRTM